MPASPFKYDSDFYVYHPALEEAVSPSKAVRGARSNRHKKHLRKQQEEIIDRAEVENFKPLKRGAKRVPQPNLPPGIDKKSPAEFFELYINDADLEGIRGFTNTYAADWYEAHKDDNLRYRACTPANLSEIKTSVRITLYIGFQVSGPA